MDLKTLKTREVEASEASELENEFSETESIPSDTSLSIQTEFLDSENFSESEQKVWYDLSKNINDLNDNSDVIPKEKSEVRLNILLIILSVILLIWANTLLWIDINLFKSPIKIEAKYSNFEGKF